MNSLCFLFAFSHVAAREVRFTERAHTCGSHCISTGRGGLLLFPPPPPSMACGSPGGPLPLQRPQTDRGFRPLLKPRLEGWSTNPSFEAPVVPSTAGQGGRHLDRGAMLCHRAASSQTYPRGLHRPCALLEGQGDGPQNVSESTL